MFYNLTCIPNKDGNGYVNEPCMNYSDVWEYNLYTEGYGGVCDLWDGVSYWCGQYCAGMIHSVWSILTVMYSV